MPGSRPQDLYEHHTRRFVELVQGPEHQIPLDEGSLLIAAHARPSLDVAAAMEMLDDLALGVDDPTAEAVVDHVFGRLGCRGDDDAYTRPEGSFLDCVIVRREGIPISLAVLLIEVGARAGVCLAGVGMPGHFLVRTCEEPARVIDPFGGRFLDVDECERLFRAAMGPVEPFRPKHLDPIGPRAILARMLLNLKNLYLQRDDTAALTWVCELRVAIPGVARRELADLAKVRAARGMLSEAADALVELAEHVPAEVAERALAKATILRSRLN